MLNREDVKRMLTDLFRTELARWRKDVLDSFDDESEDLWHKMPMDVKKISDEKAAKMFGYAPRSFSTLDNMTDYAYASYLKHQQILFFPSSAIGSSHAYEHTTQSIWEEARALAPLFTGVKRIVSLVPANHLYGFM
ncbi:MAG: hypothetical protein IKO35_04180, partial [Elusimicrobiaceae bacterium]|nr:hypothetical protein [Elusimicrobiaceae bacterium]